VAGIFKKLFCANVSLEQLSEKMGYDEETVIEILENKRKLTKEEKAIIEDLLLEKI